MIVWVVIGVLVGAVGFLVRKTYLLEQAIKDNEELSNEIFEHLEILAESFVFHMEDYIKMVKILTSLIEAQTPADHLIVKKVNKEDLN